MSRATRALIAGIVLAALSCGPAASMVLAPSADRTHPRVTPTAGGSRTSFRLTFTLRATPGHAGVMATGYRVAVGSARPGPARCAPPQPPAITSGAAGQTVRIVLAPPSRGWCRGAYAATVFLDRGPYCPPAGSCPPSPCPEFATQELDTGSASFTVR